MTIAQTFQVVIVPRNFFSVFPDLNVILLWACVVSSYRLSSHMLLKLFAARNDSYSA